jgi:protein phosphatase
VQRLLQEGRIDPEEAASSPHRHLLTQAVGTDDLIHPELRLERPAAGDTFVLTTDGVHDGIKEHEVLAAVRDVGGDLDQACARLVALANERGGKDNSTVLIVSYGEPRNVAEGPDDSTLPT